VARRFELLNAFWDRTARALPQTDALVWLALYRHARPDRTACVSFGRLAEMVGVTRRTVTRAIRRLRDGRLLKRAHRGGPDRGSNVYKLFPYDPTRGGEPSRSG
jgi:DNA-binding MarR family transcriptional regulator